MRKSLKRVQSALLAFIMTASLTACGGASTSAPAASGSSAPASSGGSTAASNQTSSTPASAETITLRLGHTQSTEHLVNETAEKFAAMVEEKTNGGIKISVYPSETLGTNKELADACSNGDVDFYISATGQYTARYQPFTIVEAFYMFRDQNHLFKFYESAPYQKLVDGLAETCDVHVLSAIYYGARQMTTSKKALKMPQDLAGLKMRAANEPLPIAAFETLGATPTPIAYNETYLALQQGVADGQENPPASIFAMKFYEVQDYLNLTYHQYQMLSIFMSDACKQKLSEEQVKILYECAKAVSAEHNTKAVEQEQGYIDQIGANCEVVESDRKAFAEAIAPMYDKFKDIWLEGMYDEIQAIQ